MKSITTSVRRFPCLIAPSKVSNLYNCPSRAIKSNNKSLTRDARDVLKREDYWLCLSEFEIENGKYLPLINAF